MDYIRFSVDGQRLDYDRKYYSSTDTIDTLYCNFKFETDDLGHILGGWDLPYLWAQFHDEEGNVYIKAVEGNVCSIPSNCLRQLKFKMTLFATDKEDYMTCEKRYTTNEIAFKFKGRANLNYDGGVSPDDPVPTQWQLLLDRVDECESTVDMLSQDLSAIDDKVNGIDGRVTSNTNAINGLSQDVTSMHGTLDDLSTELDAETTARETADTNLQSSITAESTARADDDTRLEGLITDETTAREQLDTDVRRWFTEESNARVNGDNNLQNNINGLETTVRNNYSSCMSRMNGLDGRISVNESAISGLNSRVTNNANAIEGINTTVDGLRTGLADESTARANADTNLQSQITGVSNDLSAETTARTNGDANLQSQIDAIVSQSDVVDIVGTYQELVDYDTTHLSENDIVKVLSDSTHDDGRTYYRWSHGAWSYVGTEGATYTKAETDRLINDETTARTSADADLQTQIDNEVTAREKLETEDVPRWFTEESNHRISGDNNLQQNINNLENTVRNNYSTSMSRMDELESRVTINTSTLGAVTGSLGRINNLIKAIDGTGAGFHSSIYRGKYLGDTYTDAQKQAIANGTFDDLFVGDYWAINGVNWRIADFDYYYNIGDTSFNKHHVVIVPDTTLYNAQMNSTNITTGCYTRSEMYTTNLDNARTAFDNAFGSSFIPTHRGFYSNAVSGSTPSGWAWIDMRVELMNEEQVYGHAVWGACNQNGYDVGTQKTQFKLFALDQTKINIRQDYWLTNVGSSADFAFVSSGGNVSYNDASYSLGVRPFACLVGA